MARPRKDLPNYRLHKASGQAVVTLSGETIYLGKHGTPASREAYERAVLAWRVHGRVPRGREELPLTVASMVARFWNHIESEGLYLKNGKATSERGCIAQAMRPLVALFGTTPAARFAPNDLRQVRDAMVRPAGNTTQLTRHSANKHVHRIRMAFKWAVSEGLLEPRVWDALRSVEAIRKGRAGVLESTPIGTAPLRSVAAVLRAIEPRFAALIRFQWLTGARPGEAVQLRMGDIDRAPDVWIYRPGSHKNEHRGMHREILVGPKAQRALAPFLSLDPDAYLFPGKGTGSHLTERAYSGAVRAAVQAVAGAARWTPNMLRHSAGTRIRKRFGIDAARAVLGHTSTTMTEVYAERDRRAAIDIATAIG